jgi:Ser/Thr protein kinase RdoA (MazF antagonist)
LAVSGCACHGKQNGEQASNVNDFPITKSFLSTEALAHRIEHEYNLTNVRCQLITTTLRDVYLVTSLRKRFILFVYRSGARSVEYIEAEWRFVTYLGSHGVPVAPALSTTSGTTILAFDAPEGTRYGVLTRFVDGQHLRQRPSVSAVRAYGRHIATIHTLADAMPEVLSRPVNDVAAIVEQSITAAAAALIDRRDAVTYLQECATLLLPKLAALSKAPSVYGIIHGDVIRTNAQVSDDGTVTVLDFDFCGPGWRAYDIATFLLTIGGTPNQEEFADAFLNGYTHIRTLTELEYKMLPLFRAVRAIFDIGMPSMYIDHWGSAYVYAFLDRLLEQLKHSMNRLE